MSKSEKIVFSAKKELVNFAEQFEARTFSNKMTKVNDRKVDEKNFAFSARKMLL